MPVVTQVAALEKQEFLVDQLRQLGQHAAGALGVPGAVLGHRKKGRHSGGKSITDVSLGLDASQVRAAGRDRVVETSGPVLVDSLGQIEPHGDRLGVIARSEYLGQPGEPGRIADRSRSEQAASFQGLVGDVSIGGPGKAVD